MSVGNVVALLIITIGCYYLYTMRDDLNRLEYHFLMQAQSAAAEGQHKSLDTSSQPDTSSRRTQSSGQECARSVSAPTQQTLPNESVGLKCLEDMAQAPLLGVH
jgi:hypothetical protein